MSLPATTTLKLSVDQGACHVTLNRPQHKNAMDHTMLDELLTVFDWISSEPGVRALVLRGAQGVFCAGADLKELVPPAQDADPGCHQDLRSGTAGHQRRLAEQNRRFGAVSRAADTLDVPVIAVVEGVALGGGFGLTCVSDIALAHTETLFGLPETQLGLVPAQIAPFVIQRIGVMAARRLALTGARFKAPEALALGLVDEVHSTTPALDQALATTLDQVLRCGPEANRATKRLLRRLSTVTSDHVLDQAAHIFATHALSAEGREGTTAFAEKRLPSWARSLSAGRAYTGLRQAQPTKD